MPEKFDKWIETHCYDCGGLTAEAGPRDVDHVLCFVSMEDLTPEQRAKVTPVYTVEELPKWRQAGYPDILTYAEAVVSER